MYALGNVSRNTFSKDLNTLPAVAGSINSNLLAFICSFVAKWLMDDFR